MNPQTDKVFRDEKLSEVSIGEDLHVFTYFAAAVVDRQCCSVAEGADKSILSTRWIYAYEQEGRDRRWTLRCYILRIFGPARRVCRHIQYFWNPSFGAADVYVLVLSRLKIDQPILDLF